MNLTQLPNYAHEQPVLTVPSVGWLEVRIQEAASSSPGFHGTSAGCQNLHGPSLLGCLEPWGPVALFPSCRWDRVRRRREESGAHPHLGSLHTFLCAGRPSLPSSPGGLLFGAFQQRAMSSAKPSLISPVSTVLHRTIKMLTKSLSEVISSTSVLPVKLQVSGGQG